MKDNINTVPEFDNKASQNNEASLADSIETVEKVKAKDKKPTKIKYEVSDCSRLNVRKEPSKTADVVKVLNRGETVFVDTTYKGKGFYKIFSDNSEDSICIGYVMKAYLSK